MAVFWYIISIESGKIFIISFALILGIDTWARLSSTLVWNLDLFPGNRKYWNTVLLGQSLSLYLYKISLG